MVRKVAGRHHNLVHVHACAAVYREETEGGERGERGGGSEGERGSLRSPAAENDPKQNGINFFWLLLRLFRSDPFCAGPLLFGLFFPRFSGTGAVPRRGRMSRAAQDRPAACCWELTPFLGDGVGMHASAAAAARVPSCAATVNARTQEAVEFQV